MDRKCMQCLTIYLFSTEQISWENFKVRPGTTFLRKNDFNFQFCVRGPSMMTAMEFQPPYFPPPFPPGAAQNTVGQDPFSADPYQQYAVRKDIFFKGIGRKFISEKGIHTGQNFVGDFSVTLRGNIFSCKRKPFLI